jgi:hypothetical protein
MLKDIGEILEYGRLSRLEALKVPTRERKRERRRGREGGKK